MSPSLPNSTEEGGKVRSDFYFFAVIRTPANSNTRSSDFAAIAACCARSDAFHKPLELPSVRHRHSHLRKQLEDSAGGSQVFHQPMHTLQTSAATCFFCSVTVSEKKSKGHGQCREGGMTTIYKGTEELVLDYSYWKPAFFSSSHLLFLNLGLLLLH